MPDRRHKDSTEQYKKLENDALLRRMGMDDANRSASLDKLTPSNSLFPDRRVEHETPFVTTPDADGGASEITSQIGAMQAADEVLSQRSFEAPAVTRDQVTSLVRTTGDIFEGRTPVEKKKKRAPITVMSVRRSIAKMERKISEGFGDIAAGTAFTPTPADMTSTGDYAIEATGLSIAGALGWALDSDPGQIVLGIVDPFVRSAQPWFGWMVGEGQGAMRRIADRAYPDVQEDGSIHFTTAFNMTMDYVGAMFSGTSPVTGMPSVDPVAMSESLEKIREANAVYYMPAEDQPKLLTYMDVMDAAAGGAGVQYSRTPREGMRISYVEDPGGERRRYGREAMNDIYGELDQSWYGRVGMAGLSVVSAFGELADPLMIVDPIAAGGSRLAATALRKAAPAAVLRNAIKVARRSGDWSDASVMVKRADELVRSAEAKHAAKPTERSFNQLKNATAVYENLRLEEISREVGPYSPWRPDDIAKRNPATIGTRQVSPTNAKLKNEAFSPTRGVAEANERVRDGLLKKVDGLLDTHKKAVALAKKQGGSTKGMASETKALKKLQRRVAITDVDELPDTIEVSGRKIILRDMDTIKKMQEIERIEALNKEGVQPHHYYPEDTLFDENTMANLNDQRIINGPTQAEQSGRQLAHAADSGNPEDIAMHLDDVRGYMYETGRTMPKGIRGGWIDLKEVQAAAKKFVGNAQDDAAKAIGQEIEVVQHGKKTTAIIGGRNIDMKYDDVWLPPDYEAQQMLEEGFFDTMAANSWNSMAEALMPGTFRPNGYRFLGTMNHFRESMRVWEDVDPGGLWPIFSRAQRAAESETRRHQAWFARNFERLGVLYDPDLTAAGKAVKGSQKLLMSGTGKRLKKDPARSKQVFRVINTSPIEEPDKYGKLMSAFTHDEQQAIVSIRDMLDLDAEMLGIRGMPDRYVDGYVHHAWDDAWAGRGIDIPEFRNMDADGRVFFKALMQRTGEEGYVEDIVSALDIYSRGIGRKLHTEPALEKMVKRSLQIAERDGDPFIINHVQQAVDIVRGKPSMAGQWVDRQLMSAGRKFGFAYEPGRTHRMTMALAGGIYGSLLGANRRYPVMAMATSIATTSAKYGTFRSLKGLFASATPEGQAVFKMSGLDKQWMKLIDEATGMMPATSKVEKGISKFGEFGEKMSRIRPGAPSVQESEDMIRGMTMWAHIDHTLNRLGKKSLDELNLEQQNQVFAESVSASEAINHVFGPLGRPVAFQTLSRSVTAVGTQFLSFGPKQIETLSALGRENPGYLLRFMLVSGYISRVAAQELNANVRDYVGIGFTADMLSPRNITSPGVELLQSFWTVLGESANVVSGKGDPVKMDEAVSTTMERVRKVAPLFSIVTQGAKTHERASTQKQIDPLTGAIIDPSVNLFFGLRGERSEIPSLITAIESENSRVERMARENATKLKRKYAWEAVKLGRRLEEFALDDDTAGVEKALSRMVEMGIPIGDIDSKLEASIVAMNFGQLAREVMANPKLMDKLLESLEAHHLEFE